MGKKGSTYIRNGVFTPSQVLDYITPNTNTERIYTGEDGKEYAIKMGSHRYWCFSISGLKCVSCGLEGSFFAMESHRYGSGINRFHFNLYALDEHGNDILMTKDHIIPKSKGGLNSIENYQTMCCRCNKNKGDTLPGQINYRSLNKQWVWKFIKENELHLQFRKSDEKWHVTDGVIDGIGNSFIEATIDFKMKIDGII